MGVMGGLVCLSRRGSMSLEVILGLERLGKKVGGLMMGKEHGTQEGL